MQRQAYTAAMAVLLLAFTAAGLAKLINPAAFHEQFDRFGLPGWFVLVTGAVELVAVALVVFSQSSGRRFGAAMLVATMAVATSLHVIHDPFAMALPAFALMLLACFVAVAPQPQAQ